VPSFARTHGEPQELVDLEVRTKLVKNKLRELRHRFLLRSREHAEGALGSPLILSLCSHT
jgi:hypothetical protein